jgi:outer membrane murein-binding lipoprotein Lpp
MSDTLETPPSPPPPPPPPAPPAAPVERPTRTRRRSLLVSTAVGAASFIVGVVAGAAIGGGTDTVEVPGDVPQEQLDELDAKAAELDAREDQLDAREEELAAAEEAAPGEEATGETTTPAGPGQTYTAGHYEFADVQVVDDGVGDFMIVTRVTNTGGSVESVAWKATLFNGGAVVGVLDGYAETFDSGETMTVQFFSVDDYGDWDDLEFQVDMEL